MALNPETERYVQQRRLIGQPDFGLFGEHSESEAAYLLELRTNFPVLSRAEDAEHLTVADIQIAGGGGQDLTLRLYTPVGSRVAARPLCLFLHGGGWVAGGPSHYDSFCGALSRAAEAIVVSVDYRLAPEHPFPAALDDSFAALEWASENAETLGTHPDRIGVVGISAGGNLAAAVAIRARDRRGPQLCLQALVYPVLDSAMDSESHRSRGAGYVTTHQQLRWFWSQYVRVEEDRKNPEVSPLEVPDATRLPPALIAAAGYDPLHDEAIEYAARLDAAGVSCAVCDFPTQIHGFASLFPDARDTMTLLTSIARAFDLQQAPRARRGADGRDTPLAQPH